jgi:7-cyano-7-deazaguanine synthase
MHSAVVLLSSGLDSTVNLYKGVRELQVRLVLTFDYGQRAAVKEIEHSRKICSDLKLPHQIIDLKWLSEITSTALVNKNETVPQGSDVQIDNFTQSMVTAKAVWVPNRNGVFLNIAAAVAESLKADFVVPGFNKEEATTFPDNSVDYLKALDRAFSFSTATQVKTLCYTQNMDKTEIVKLARELNVPLNEVWPCYFSGAELCKECESCKRFFRALGA